MQTPPQPNKDILRIQVALQGCRSSLDTKSCDGTGRRPLLLPCALHCLRAPGPGAGGSTLASRHHRGAPIEETQNRPLPRAAPKGLRHSRRWAAAPTANGPCRSVVGGRWSAVGGRRPARVQGQSCIDVHGFWPQRLAHAYGLFARQRIIVYISGKITTYRRGFYGGNLLLT
jgi:hypothetical protein